MKRTTDKMKVYLLVAALAFVASCNRSGEWPAPDAADLGDVVYLSRETAAGPTLVAVSASGEVRETGIRADGESDAAVSPDGKYLYYGVDSELRRHGLADGGDELVCKFPAGVAREKEIGISGETLIYSWRCGYRFRDISFAPDGRVAFVLDSLERPMSDKEPALYFEDMQELPELIARSNFQADTGAYIVAAGGPPGFLGETVTIFGFTGEGRLLLENKLTVAEYDFGTGEVRPLLPKDSHELGWLPEACAAGGKVVVAAARAQEKSSETILNRVYVVTAGPPSKPFMEIRAKEPATRAALSADGRFFAMQETPRVMGEPRLVVVDLEKKKSKELVAAGRLIRFSAGSQGLFYITGAGRAGDVYFAGLDGASRRLTTSGGFLPPP